MKWFIIACIFLPLLCRSQSTDDIMTEGKVGDDIVKQVLHFLEPYIIPLHSKYLQALAVIRSNNGVPYVADVGGIWRVNVSQLSDALTACQTSLFNQCNISKTLTGEDFSSFDISDLDKPLYSALAMIFYVLSLQVEDYSKYCKLFIQPPGASTEPFKLFNQRSKTNISTIPKKSYTRENITAIRFYFAHPDPTKFIQCTELGTYYVMPCAPGTIWSQSAYTCVIDNGRPVTKDTSETSKVTKPTTQCTFLKNNPCTKENIKAGKFYFAHPDPTKFIKCTEWGTYYIMPCAPGTVWSQNVYTCVRSNENTMTETTAEIIPQVIQATMSTRIKNNPCTKDNIEAGKFYFVHPDPTKFIQCTEWGTYYVMPCAPGTIWSHTYYTCIDNFVECNSREITTAPSRTFPSFSSTFKGGTRREIS